MGDFTLLERVITLEQSIADLKARLDTLSSSVLIQKKRGPKPLLNRREMERNIRRKIKKKLIERGYDPARAGFKRAIRSKDDEKTKNE